MNKRTMKTERHRSVLTSRVFRATRQFDLRRHAVLAYRRLPGELARKCRSGRRRRDKERVREVCRGEKKYFVSYKWQGHSVKAAYSLDYF
jgi:hypothetical protein